MLSFKKTNIQNKHKVHANLGIFLFYGIAKAPSYSKLTI